VKRFAVVALLLVAVSAPAADVYVAPMGKDGAAGTAAAPVASLVGARDAVRALKANGVKEPIRVLVQPGRYAISEPLVLEPQDSGTPGAPISYEAAPLTPGPSPAKGEGGKDPAARPVICGGRAISGWTAGKDGVWTAQVPDVAAGKWYFEQLFINGRRATRARSPNKFFYYIENVQQEILAPAAKGPRAKQARQTVRLRADDYAASLAKVAPDELRDVNLVVYHNWDNTRRLIDQLDPASHSLVTTGEGLKPWNPWKRNSHYIVENFRAALDAPGEWYLSRTGTLYYMPLPGEDMSKAQVVAPVAEKFVVLRGDPAAGKFVEHVAFRGLSFVHAQWLTPPAGFEANQAAQPIDATIMADGARHVTFEDCEIGHVGTYALWFRKGCSNCALRRSLVHDFGAGGVRIGEAAAPRSDAEQTNHNEVDNCIIRHGGYIFPCAVGVWIGQSDHNRIGHNEIADLFYTGISAGWVWGYGKSLTKCNTIEFNHVHHLGWGLLSDMGGIYTLGPSEGTVVRNNVFHDIYAYSYGGWGMYTDEGSTGILFENNLTYRTKTGGFHQHYGKENVLRNNVMALSKLQQWQATRVEEHLSFTLENNVVYYDEGLLLAGPWDKVRFESRNNCFWQAADKPVEFLGKPLADWQAKGHEQGSIVADPKLTNPAKDDFRVAADSPAVALGFVPFNPGQAGVYGDAAWKKQAQEVRYPALEIAPPPPPAPIHDTFENAPLNQAPGGVEVHVENRGDAILVTDATAAEGRRSVKIVDAPGLKQAFNPHLVYGGLTFDRGTLENRFALRVERESLVQFEWRDYSVGQYQVGPRFSIRQGVLTVGDKKVELPLDTWVGFSIRATLSPDAAPRWQLTVTLPGQPPKVFADLESGSPGFRKLQWVGFTSGATKSTTFYLDDFHLAPAGK